MSPSHHETATFGEAKSQAAIAYAEKEIQHLRLENGSKGMSEEERRNLRNTIQKLSATVVQLEKSLEGAQSERVMTRDDMLQSRNLLWSVQCKFDEFAYDQDRNLTKMDELELQLKRLQVQYYGSGTRTDHRIKSIVFAALEDQAVLSKRYTDDRIQKLERSLQQRLDLRETSVTSCYRCALKHRAGPDNGTRLYDPQASPVKSEQTYASRQSSIPRTKTTATYKSSMTNDITEQEFTDGTDNTRSSNHLSSPHILSHSVPMTGISRRIRDEQRTGEFCSTNKAPSDFGSKQIRVAKSVAATKSKKCKDGNIPPTSKPLQIRKAILRDRQPTQGTDMMESGLAAQTSDAGWKCRAPSALQHAARHTSNFSPSKACETQARPGQTADELDILSPNLETTMKVHRAQHAFSNQTHSL